MLAIVCRGKATASPFQAGALDTSRELECLTQAVYYEAAREELVEVVRKLESGGAPLADSMALWKRGEELAAICQGIAGRVRDFRPDGYDADHAMVPHGMRMCLGYFKGTGGPIDNVPAT